jgi:hypothetical protein
LPLTTYSQGAPFYNALSIANALWRMLTGMAKKMTNGCAI